MLGQRVQSCFPVMSKCKTSIPILSDPDSLKGSTKLWDGAGPTVRRTETGSAIHWLGDLGKAPKPTEAQVSSFLNLGQSYLLCVCHRIKSILISLVFKLLPSYSLASSLITPLHVHTDLPTQTFLSISFIPRQNLLVQVFVCQNCMHLCISCSI